jgi:isopenicillin-N epimerase
MSDLARHWMLDPAIDFLNHGSFGACPRAVLEWQSSLRAEIERQPVEFLARRLGERLDAAREKLAAFLGADPAGLVAVANATAGVNTVLRSLDFRPGDEVLATDHGYNACRNALDFAAAHSGARVVAARVPFPVSGEDEIVDAIAGAATERTRLLLVDHVTSPTGLVLPLARIVSRFAERGVDVLVDGAHAPGMLPLNVGALGAAWYVGNCHKWLCAPKGAAFLWAREDRRERLRPLVISHGANTRRPGRSRFHDEFDWTGTGDPTPFLSVPKAIEWIGSLVPGGWPEVRRRNHDLAVAGRRAVARALDIAPPCPDPLIGSLAALPLPDGDGRSPAPHTDPLQQTLLGRHRIEVPIVPWPAPPRRLVRLSAQLYNDLAQYERLGAALRCALDVQ